MKTYVQQLEESFLVTLKNFSRQKLRTDFKDGPLVDKDDDGAKTSRMRTRLSSTMRRSLQAQVSRRESVVTHIVVGIWSPRTQWRGKVAPVCYERWLRHRNFRSG